MSNLGIKHEVANQIVLADQSAGVLTKVVEDLHYLVGLHNLLEAVKAGVNGAKVDQEALVSKVYLDQLHISIFCEALTIHSKNRSIFWLSSVHYGLRKLLDLPWLSDNIVAWHPNLIDLLS